jgi:hypothetical protein
LPRLEALEDRTVPSTLMVVNDHDAGPGSLRQAILDANAAPDLDTIVFADAVHKITLTSGELAITNNLNIAGSGAESLTISGNNVSRIFDITSGAVNITGLTITQGRADQNAPNLPSAGGGILSQASLSLAGVVLSGNQAIGNAATAHFYGPYFLVGDALGGGIANLGTLTVTGCSFRENQAQGADGSVGPNYPNIVYPGSSFGGGLDNLLGTASITGSEFRGNQARGGSGCTGAFAGTASGGAIFNNTNLTVTSSAFSDNQALGGSRNTSDIHDGHALGGAIGSGSVAALFNAGSASLRVFASEFAANQARGGDDNTITLPVALTSQADGPSDGLGGGLCVFQGSATISLSRFAANQARGGAGGADQKGSLGIGGGLFLFNFIGGVSGTIDGCQLDANVALGGPGRMGGAGGAGLGGGLALSGLGAAFSGPGTVNLSHAIVDNNLAQGGAGGNGGDGLGGGLFNDMGSTLTASASLILDNRAWGGHGGAGGQDGQGIGGGVYNKGDFHFDASTLIAHNRASTTNDDLFP